MVWKTLSTASRLHLQRVLRIKGPGIARYYKKGLAHAQVVNILSKDQTYWAAIEEKKEQSEKIARRYSGCVTEDLIEWWIPQRS